MVARLLAPYTWFSTTGVGCVYVSITTWTDRKLTRTHTARVTQQSHKYIRISGDTKLELYWIDSIRECHANTIAYILKETGLHHSLLTLCFSLALCLLLDISLWPNWSGDQCRLHPKKELPTYILILWSKLYSSPIFIFTNYFWMKNSLNHVD